MSRKSNLAQTSAIACTLSLLLSSTAWAAAVSVHVTVPIVHPKVPVVTFKGTVTKVNAPKVVHIPRIGQEVIVGFEEGNPDQPIIVGSVYNHNIPPSLRINGKLHRPATRR